MKINKRSTSDTSARFLRATTILLFCWIAPGEALAVEGGMQRPISGIQIAPFAGVIPPEPGFDVVVSEIYYSGSIGGAANVPIGGLFVANVDVKASFTPITLLYIWPTPTKTWNFGGWISTGVGRGRRKRFTRPVHRAKKRQRLRSVRSCFYSTYSEPSL